MLVYLKEITAHKRFLPIAFRSCSGILSLEEKYRLEQLVAACACVSQARLCGYQKVFGILEKGSDADFLPSADGCGTEGGLSALPCHKNIRGREYFSKTITPNNLKTVNNENK